MSLSTKIGLMVVLSLVILTGAISLAVYAVTEASARRTAQDRQDANMRVAWSSLYRYGHNIRVQDGVLYAGNQALNNFNDPVDEIKQLVGGTATIFMGDTRIATNVRLPNGDRAVGTRLAAGPVHDAVLMRGEPYRGEAQILGTPFFTAYDPIKDEAGSVIGVLYVGIPLAVFMQAVDQVQLRIIEVAAALDVVIAGLCLALARRWFAPLRILRLAMQALAAGDRSINLAWAERTDEIGGMTRAVHAFRDAALEKLEIEAAAETARRQADAERRTLEAERAAVTQNQVRVVAGLAAALERLAEGDLTSRLESAFAPEYEKLRSDFNAATGQLQATVRVIKGNAEGIRTGTAEITRDSDNLGRRTEQQAASLTETASALDQITATVRRTADGAAQAGAMVATTQGEAKHSEQVVRDATAAMGAIEASAQEINQIIGVIDEIAFQTNLLALNAGVEAARAGDAGRGFAVVASEVRMLAQRSTAAARQIKTLIATSTQQVGRGVMLVGETSQVLVKIMRQVASINEVVTGIAAAAHEQAAGLHQVNTAINHMDQVTQQNAAMVSQGSTASHALEQDAEALLNLTSRFQTEPSGTRNPQAKRHAA